jgi:hypothetical protein
MRFEGKPSKIVQSYIDWLSDMKSQQEENWATVVEEDGRVQDYLHEVEFAEGADALSEVSQRLHESRLKRRIAKDKAKALKPIKDYMDDATCKAHIKRLTRLVKELEQVESYIDSDRVYKPRGKAQTEDVTISYEEATESIDVSYLQVMGGVNAEYADDEPTER